MQRLVHSRVYRSIGSLSKQMRLCPVPGQHHRSSGHPLLLHRYPPSGALIHEPTKKNQSIYLFICLFLSLAIDTSRGQRGYPRVLLHHPHFEAVQIDTSLARSQDPRSHVQSVGQRVGTARLLPRPWYRRLCQSRLLR